MLNADNKYLQLRCSSYKLVLNISFIVEISDYSKDWCFSSENAYQHHGKKVLWHDSELLFIDMRALLNVDAATIHEPAQVLILKTSTNDTPFAMLGVDEVFQITDIMENQWHWLSGINTQLDSFFDRLYAEKESKQIFMRLKPTEHWATENTIKTYIINNNTGVTDAY